MEILTKLCKDTKNGKFAQYTACEYTGVYPNVALGKVIEKLAYYENLEDEGRLIILSVSDIYPCKHCDRTDCEEREDYEKTESRK